MENTLNNLLVKLNEFNSLGSADAIAKKFVELDIKGYRRNPYLCPVKIYLHHYCKIISVRSVTQGDVRYNFEYIHINPEYLNIVGFIEKFDVDQYPQIDQTLGLKN